MSVMAKRCYYEVLGVQRTANDGGAQGRLPQARHAASTRTAIRATRTASTASRKSTKPTTSSRTSEKRAAYDRFGHAAFEHGAGGGAHGFGSDFGSSLRRHLRRPVRHGRPARRRARPGRERGADLRYNMEITLEEAFAGKTAQVRIPTSVTCEACSGHRRQGGTRPTHLPDLRRPGPGAPRAGLLHARAHLPGLPRPRPGDRGPVSRRARARAASRASARCR